MVPFHVSPDYIQGVIVNCEKLKKQLAEKHPSLKVTVNDSVFLCKGNPSRELRAWEINAKEFTEGRPSSPESSDDEGDEGTIKPLKRS